MNIENRKVRFNERPRQMSNSKTMEKLNFDTKIYPVEAIMGAAYKMLDELYVHLENGDGATVAVLTAKNGKASDLKNIAETFREEALSQALRIKILKATRSTRDQILKIAITYAPFLQQDGQTAVQQQGPCDCEEIDAELENILRQLKEEDVEHDFAKDPLDILVPWEEKNKEPICETAEERRKAEERNGVCDKV
jgi:His-Xaa-Ser system protein HxsD